MAIAVLDVRATARNRTEAATIAFPKGSFPCKLTTLSPFFIVTSLRAWSPSSRSLFVSLNFFGLPMRFLDYDTRAEAFDAAG